MQKARETGPFLLTRHKSPKEKSKIKKTEGRRKMKKMILLAALLGIVGVSQSARAQDATCAKLKNPNHRAACNCHASAGGVINQEPSGRITWNTRGGNSNMALQNCLAKIQ
jgi:hypothetical protein